MVGHLRFVAAHISLQLAYSFIGDDTRLVAQKDVSEQLVHSSTSDSHTNAPGAAMISFPDF